MEILKLSHVISANREGLTEPIRRAQIVIDSRRTLLHSISKTININPLLDQTQEQIVCNDIAQPEAITGAYFGIENIIAGSMVKPTLDVLAPLSRGIISSKLKLGPGIGFIKAPDLYSKLIALGNSDPKLTINYGPTYATERIREAVTRILDPEGVGITNEGSFVTMGATEGIDIFLEAMTRMYPKSRIVSIGMSYYTSVFAADKKGLLTDRLIINSPTLCSETRFLPTPTEIGNLLPIDTKAIILTIPSNPTGENYTDTDLRTIFQIAKERKISVLFDAIFANMYFDEDQNYRSRIIKIAQEVGFTGLTIIDSLSKSVNYAGERIGFLSTTDQEMAKRINELILERRCNDRLVLEPLLLFEGLARQVKAHQISYPRKNLASIINEIWENDVYPFDKNYFTNMYEEWSDWHRETQQYYRNNLIIVKTLLSNVAETTCPDTAAFNTIVRVKNVPIGTNNMDFAAKLMFTLATYTQVGPCF
jgi:aspartate/methionine/tyrosine aminotransferase